MKVVLQRVKSARVETNGDVTGKINQGLLILLAVHKEDTEEDLNRLVKKVVQLRIFSDEEGKMNLSMQDIGAAALIVSQFTLYSNTRKGNRPSFINSASPEKARSYYEKFITQIEKEIGSELTQTGEFGADMQVFLVNDGPVTIDIDTKKGSL